MGERPSCKVNPAKHMRTSPLRTQTRHLLLAGRCYRLRAPVLATCPNGIRAGHLLRAAVRERRARLKARATERRVLLVAKPLALCDRLRNAAPFEPPLKV